MLTWPASGPSPYIQKTLSGVYAQYFNLREMPFSITPDPAYLYLSARHQEALGHLLYGTGQYGGFVQLTGEVGTGKTTVVRALLEQNIDGVEVAMIHNPRQSEREFVQAICDELRAKYVDGARITQKDLIDTLNLHLLRNHANGKRTVLIIDEAQNLSPGVLEQVRLLTNLETNKEKLLRIMLVGQPELNALLAREDLRQLASRITARYHLAPLEEGETREYVRHRLAVAGSHENLFPDDAINEVQRYARGIPRLINILCDRALLGAYTRHTRPITPQIVREAAVEVLGQGKNAAAPIRRASSWMGHLDRRSSGGLPRLSLSWLESILISLALMIAGALIYQTVLTVSLDAPEVTGQAEEATTEPLPGDSRTETRTDTAASPPGPGSRSADSGFLPSLIDLPVQTAPIDPQGLKKLLASDRALGRLTRELISLWDRSIRIPGTGPVCKKLKQHALECYRTNGSLRDLRKMDRPAILSLRGENGGQVYGLVTQLTEDRARFSLEQGAVEVGLGDLNAAWTGEMLLFWERETEKVQILPNHRGEHVVWLRERLAEMMGKPLPGRVSDRFDDELKQLVAQFQAARGLDADGIVGIRTRIALSDPVAGTPTLRFVP